MICRVAASASAASFLRVVKKSGDWPVNSPIAVKKLTTPMAIPVVSVGRMIEHLAWLRHDEVRLKQLSAKGRLIEIGERQPIRGIGQGRSVAGFVLPGLK